MKRFSVVTVSVVNHMPGSFRLSMLLEDGEIASLFLDETKLCKAAKDAMASGRWADDKSDAPPLELRGEYRGELHTVFELPPDVARKFFKLILALAETMQ